MKKLLALIFVLSPLLLACSSDDEENSDKLKFIQIQVVSEDTPTPKGNVYLYRVDGKDIKSDKPSQIAYSPLLWYNYNGESKSMSPISSYGSRSDGQLIMSPQKGYSSTSFYWNNLSVIYGAPQKGDEYLVYIELRDGNYARSSKRFTLTKNSLIKVKLPSHKEVEASKDNFFEGEWSIEDYK